MSDLSVCNCGGSPVTSIVSLVVPTWNWTSTRCVPSADTGTLPCSNDLNPAAFELDLINVRDQVRDRIVSGLVSRCRDRSVLWSCWSRSPSHPRLPHPVDRLRYRRCFRTRPDRTLRSKPMPEPCKLLLTTPTVLSFHPPQRRIGSVTRPPTRYCLLLGTSTTVVEVENRKAVRNNDTRRVGE